jgi:hyperosmotically inducible protein
MKTTDLFRALCGGVVIMVACHAAAQPNAASASVSATTTASSTQAIKTYNRKLRRDVLHALAKSRELDAQQTISARVSGGAVTLTGWVSSADQIDKAGAIAQAVPGVKSVNNRIGVSIPR